jgi:hypothetical protein
VVRLALCSVVTEPLLDEFRLLKWSVELFHPGQYAWYVQCDRTSEDSLKELPQVHCERFTDADIPRRRTGESGFDDLMLNKMDAMERAWSSQSCDAVAFLDADIVVTSSFLEAACALDKPVVLSPCHYPARSKHLSPYLGYFNGGFTLTKDKTFHRAWKESCISQPWKTDQTCLNDVAPRFQIGMLDHRANVGFWRSAEHVFFKFSAIPHDCTFFHVHMFSALRNSRERLDRMFALHCLRFLRASTNPKHKTLLGKILALDRSGFFATCLPMMGDVDESETEILKV